MHEISPNSIVTEDGLVLKNVEKIEEVDTRMERRIDLDTYSWQICRHLRRDFNIMAAKMFKMAAPRASTFRAPIQDLLMEITLQAMEFDAQSQKYGDPAEHDTRTLPIRLISPQSAVLFNALRQADRAYARTNWAIEQGQITLLRQSEDAEGFEVAYSGLKRYLFARGGAKTAGEMGEAMGIS